MYWLVPVTSIAPLTLGEMRIRCEGEPLETLRRLLREQHPFALPLFKTEMLLEAQADCDAPEAEAVCEKGEAPAPSLGDSTPLVFDGRSVNGRRLRLSHCAEAFLAKLPSAAEQSSWLTAVPASKAPACMEWLDLLLAWTGQGYICLLLKEASGNESAGCFI